MKYSFSTVVILSLALAIGCIEEIDVFTGSAEGLVVDGNITNEQGPQRVRLSTSRQYNTVPDYFEVEGATVAVTDDQGNVETFSYAKDGYYESSDGFFGQPGRSYQLKVKLRDGRQYESSFESMPSPPVVDSMYYKVDGTLLDFYADFSDNSEEENFYRWRYSGTYEVVAPIAMEMSRTNQQMPKSDDCIDWFGKPPFAKDVARCWVKEFDNAYLKVDSDLLFNGRSLKEYEMFSMEMDRRLDRGYLVEIEQHSLTSNAYKYWTKLRDQMNNNGTIFETNNYQIRGNIVSTTDVDEVVLGYFNVSSVAIERVFVGDFLGLYGDVPCEENNSGCFPQRCMDCRKFAANSSTLKPDDWPN